MVFGLGPHVSHHQAGLGQLLLEGVVLSEEGSLLSLDLFAFSRPVSAGTVAAASGDASITVLDLALEMLNLTTLLTLVMLEFTALLLELLMSTIFRVVFVTQSAQLLLK